MVTDVKRQQALMLVQLAEVFVPVLWIEAVTWRYIAVGLLFVVGVYILLTDKYDFLLSGKEYYSWAWRIHLSVTVLSLLMASGVELIIDICMLIAVFLAMIYLILSLTGSNNIDEQ